MNSGSKSVIMELSDGSYNLPALIMADKPADGKEERFDCDQNLIRMISEGLLRVGDKV